ncbi:hypothetical protein GDO81_019940, partial [Engystomops pustulosus]
QDYTDYGHTCLHSARYDYEAALRVHHCTGRRSGSHVLCHIPGRRREPRAAVMSAAWKMWLYVRQRLRSGAVRDVCRQYPLLCFVLLVLSLSTVLLLRYLHILMIFWSFLAGVVTLYCTLEPETLLPNILFNIKHKPKVQYYMFLHF